MRRASIVSRFFAILIDIFLSAFFTVALVFLLMNWVADSNVALAVIFVLVIGAISSVMFKDVIDGRSVGKRIFGIGVRELEGTLPSKKKLIARNFTSFFWPKDIYYLLFSEEKRKQGDRRNGTDVYQLSTMGTLQRVITIVFSIVLIAGLFIGGIFALIKQDASYKAAIAFIEEETSIQEIVGNHIRFGFFPSGSMSISNGYGQAGYKIKVSGEKGSISVFIALVKEPKEAWEVRRIQY